MDIFQQDRVPVDYLSPEGIVMVHGMHIAEERKEVRLEWRMESVPYRGRYSKVTDSLSILDSSIFHSPSEPFICDHFCIEVFEQSCWRQRNSPP